MNPSFRHWELSTITVRSFQTFTNITSRLLFEHNIHYDLLEVT